MTQDILTEKDYYRTPDLALAAAIYLFNSLETVDKPPNSRKAYFLFKRSAELDELVEAYWKDELKVSPQAYFNALRVIKARLYGEK